MLKYIADKMQWDVRNIVNQPEALAGYQIDPELALQLRHIIDYLHVTLTQSNSLPTQYQTSARQLQSCTVETLLKRTALFDQWSQRKAVRQQIEGLKENVDFREIISGTLKDGMRLIELLTPKALNKHPDLRCIRLPPWRIKCRRNSLWR